MNNKLIAERCHAAGLNVHEAARRVHIDPFPFHDVAENRHEDDRVPFGVLRTLSQLLDIDVADLVEVPVATCVEPGDDVRVEAAFAAFPTGVTRDELARCFAWSLERVERAIAALEVRLRPSGRRLRRTGWHRYALGPNLSILSPEEQIDLTRAVGRQREPLDHQWALVLHQITEGWSQPRFYNEAAETVGDLLDKHLIERRNGDLEPSPDVIFSLCLDEY